MSITELSCARLCSRSMFGRPKAGIRIIDSRVVVLNLSATRNRDNRW